MRIQRYLHICDICYQLSLSAIRSDGRNGPRLHVPESLHNCLNLRLSFAENGFMDKTKPHDPFLKDGAKPKMHSFCSRPPTALFTKRDQGLFLR